MNRFMYPLDIQHFAEGGENQTPPEEKPVAIDYEKLADIVSKRSNSAEDSVLKGYFKEQGLNPEQMQAAIQQYKDTQAQKKKDEAAAVANLKTENETLKKQILASQLDSRITALAGEKQISTAYVPYLLKLIDRSEMVGADGKIQDEKVKAGIDNLLKDFPMFTAKNEPTGSFQQIGAGGNENNNQADADAALRAAFGLKAKKG